MSTELVKHVVPGSTSETVTARLNAAGAYVTATKESADRVQVARTDTSGLYQFQLTPNALITPAGTSWTVTEPGGKSRTIVVLAGAPGGGWDVTELEVDDPAEPDPVNIGATLITVARNPDLIIAGTVVRDSNGAALSAPVVWPDGTPGTYTADVVSSAFPGAVDGYHVTYGSPLVRTYTQPTITRDAGTGAATIVPAIVVS